MTSYMPGGAATQAAVEETFTLSMEGDLTKEWCPMPIATQKHINVQYFDPAQKLFKMGVHMPLLVFLGDKARRNPEAIQRREERARGRW